MNLNRVTVGSASYGALAGLQSAASKLAALQAKLSSGKQITHPSDDPPGTVRALQLRARLDRNSQYANNATDATGWMSAADTSYSQMVALVQKARTLVVQGLNTGTATGTSASAIADQIDALRSSLISLANTSYNGRPVFGGTTAGDSAYDASGAYLGDNGTVSRTVGAGTTVQINQTGPQVFGADGDPTNLFTLLSGIATKLRTNPVPASLSGDLTSLDTAITRISTAQAAEGASYQRVQTAQQTQADTKVELKSQLSQIEDIDLASTAIAVSTANANYQAALQTTANIEQISLLNFLD
jgi:flagellar hook-associated protein 3 FlgL